MTILQLKNITKSFIDAKEKLQIIKNANLTLKKGQIIALTGPSGCGKTTILQIAGLLDNPTSGQLVIDNIDTTKKNDRQKCLIRRSHIGFVYQSHLLMDEFNALENAAMPLLISGVAQKQAYKTAQDLLEKVDLQDRLNHRPSQLSGGQQQRVAIIRAIINNPKIILADEPTGNLDPNSAQIIFNLLLKTIKENNISAIIVTHNDNLAKKCDEIHTIKNQEL